MSDPNSKVAFDVDNVRWVGDLARIETRPGDVFVLMFPRALTNEIAEQIRAQWQGYLPGTKAVVLGDGARVGVINANDITPTGGDHAAVHP